MVAVMAKRAVIGVGAPAHALCVRYGWAGPGRAKFDPLVVDWLRDGLDQSLTAGEEAGP
jgi:hypothetical protein